MTASVIGIRGSYSEEAAHELLGPSVRLLHCVDFDQAFDAVKCGRARHTVVPLRNSIVGEITAVAALIEHTGLQVLNKIEIPVHHVLAGAGDVSIDSVTHVASHPAALGQCSRFFASNPGISVIETGDTASAVRDIVSAHNSHRAAICSRRAANIYSAKIICEDIADETDNRTIFGLIGTRS